MNELERMLIGCVGWDGGPVIDAAAMNVVLDWLEEKGDGRLGDARSCVEFIPDEETTRPLESRGDHLGGDGEYREAIGGDLWLQVDRATGATDLSPNENEQELGVFATVVRRPADGKERCIYSDAWTVSSLAPDPAKPLTLPEAVVTALGHRLPLIRWYALCETLGSPPLRLLALCAAEGQMDAGGAPDERIQGLRQKADTR
jgi:hypothetical protein